jgi:predicted nucleic acid-binding protein
MPTDTTAERAVVLLDTSAAIALVVEDHEAHAAMLDAVGGRRLGLAGHAWFETYSVLTRLPGGQRRSPADALRLLEHDFPESAFLRASESVAVGREIARLGVSGGAVYDALIGAAARQHRRRLLSADARARPVYEALGVDLELIRATD